MKSVFVTGGTGFVGSHAVARLLAQGWRVRALVRKPNRTGLLPAGAERVAGEISRPESYRSALHGVSGVLHVAGATRARTLAEYRLANAAGAGAVARTADEAAPEAMFVLVSSQSAAGPSRNGSPVREQDEPHPVSWYGISKLEGEDAVASARTGPWCAVRPCVVYGPGDPGLLQLFSLIARGIAPLPLRGRSRVQLISADDLAGVLTACLERRDMSGRRAFAAGPSVTTGEIVSYLSSLRRGRPISVRVPAWAIRVAAAVESAREIVTRRPRPFNRDKAREMLSPNWLCDAAPFLGELDIPELKDWKGGLLETLVWYLQEGWIAPTFNL